MKADFERFRAAGAIVIREPYGFEGEEGLIAFQAMVDGQTQIAVMKPGTGSWTVLTRDRSRGLQDALAWSHDGSRIYYDRMTDTPQGIYSVPALGGEYFFLHDRHRSHRPVGHDGDGNNG